MGAAFSRWGRRYGRRFDAQGMFDYSLTDVVRRMIGNAVAAASTRQEPLGDNVEKEGDQFQGLAVSLTFLHPWGNFNGRGY